MIQVLTFFDLLPTYRCTECNTLEIKNNDIYPNFIIIKTNFLKLNPFCSCKYPKYAKINKIVKLKEDLLLLLSQLYIHIQGVHKWYWQTFSVGQSYKNDPFLPKQIDILDAREHFSFAICKNQELGINWF